MFGRDQFYQASSQQTDLRLPRTLPKCMSNAKTAASSAAAPSSTKASGPAAKKPQKQPVQQRYIPGLNSADQPNVVVPPNAATRRHLPTEVSPEMVEAFLDGSKQPISALMEYATAMKIVVIFEEVRVERPSILNKFANRVKANGKALPQGVGKTKKEAKTSAARIAMNLLLGLGEDGIDEEDDGASISKASILTSTTFEPQVALPSVEEAGVRPLWDPPKHPVSRFTEYCSRNMLDIDWVISDNPTEMGFKAEVHINNGLVAEAYALTKKDAKKKAAESAIQKMCPQHLKSVENSESTKPSKPQPLNSWSAPSHEGNGDQPTTTRPNLVPQPAISNYVIALQQFAARNDIRVEICSSDKQGTDGFEAYVNVDNNAVAFSQGVTQAEARNRAAEEAFKYLSKHVKECPEPKLESLPFHDQISALAHRMFKKLLAPTGESVEQHKYLAAFIIKRAGTEDLGKVVALGTGNTCLPASCRSTGGRVMNDCHFSVIAHRALLKYFHRELKIYFEGNLVHSIFEPLDGTTQLTFKEGVSLHLYLSRAPCGDMSLYTTEPDGALSTEDMEIMEQAMHYPSFPDDNAGYTSVKQEKGFEVTLASDEAPTLGSMSSSEKILKWNTVGLQGALFGHFLAPLYLSSITMGSMYDHGNLSRAVAGRLTDDIAEYLPAGFRVNYPYLGRTTTCDPSLAQSQISPESINWSFGDEMIEIVSGHTGKSCDRSPFRTSVFGASRLSKAGFLFRFREIARLAHNESLLKLQTYSACKSACADYQKAKATLIEHLEVTGFGFWVKKPEVLEAFSQ